MEKAIAPSKLLACSLDELVSQEQINVYHMHGYTAACVLPENFCANCSEIVAQSAQKYAVITIKNPFIKPFTLIPNAYKTLMRYM